MELVHQEDQEGMENKQQQKQKPEPEEAILTKAHLANAAECIRR